MTNRKRTEGLEEKRPTPETVRRSVEKSRARTLKRDHAPIVTHKRLEDGRAEWEWPFDDEGDWRWLVFDAFGTRNGNIAAIFIEQLCDLTSREWDEDRKAWYPNDAELGSLLAIVASTKPKNEAQAAMAAQMAAVHLMAMRVAHRIGDKPWDTKMIAAFTRLTRTYALQMEAFESIKGRGRSSRQKIVVSHEKHVHQHQHVHVVRGAEKFGSQPHESRTAADGECPTLPGPNPLGEVVPIASRKGKARVS